MTDDDVAYSRDRAAAAGAEIAGLRSEVERLNAECGRNLRAAREALRTAEAAYAAVRVLARRLVTYRDPAYPLLFLGWSGGRPHYRALPCVEDAPDVLLEFLGGLRDDYERRRDVP